MTDTDRLTRRSVLKATGAAASGGAVLAGAAGSVAAGHVGIGDCVEVTASSGLYRDACPRGDLVGTISAGTRGSVGNTCTDADGEEWVYVNSRENRTQQGWVFGANVEPC